MDSRLSEVFSETLYLPKTTRERHQGVLQWDCIIYEEKQITKTTTCCINYVVTLWRFYCRRINSARNGNKTFAASIALNMPATDKRVPSTASSIWRPWSPLPSSSSSSLRAWQRKRASEGERGDWQPPARIKLLHACTRAPAVPRRRDAAGQVPVAQASGPRRRFSQARTYWLLSKAGNQEWEVLPHDTEKAQLCTRAPPHHSTPHARSHKPPLSSLLHCCWTPTRHPPVSYMGGGAMLCRRYNDKLPLNWISQNRTVRADSKCSQWKCSNFFSETRRGERYKVWPAVYDTWLIIILLSAAHFLTCSYSNATRVGILRYYHTCVIYIFTQFVYTLRWFANHFP